MAAATTFRMRRRAGTLARPSRCVRTCDRPLALAPKAAQAARLCRLVSRSRLCQRQYDANTARGAAHFLRETISRVRRAGASGQLTMRADSSFYAHAVVAVCRRIPGPLGHARDDGLRRDKKAGNDVTQPSTFVWIDSRGAVIVRWQDDRPRLERVASEVPAHHRATGHVRHDPGVRHGGGPPQTAAAPPRLGHLD